MNLTQFKCLIVLSIFAMFGVGPISLTCIVGWYVVVARPQWFLKLAADLYDMPYPYQFQPATSGLPHAFNTRVTCIAVLLLLFIADILPIPVTGVIAIFITLVRPVWFYRLAGRIYGQF